MKGSGLSRHLIILMIQLVCSSLLITFITWYAWVGLAVMVFGEQAKQFDYVATTSDWVQLGVSAGLSIIVAVITAVRFAKKILHPLQSLADSARRIAGGELSARADAGDRRLSETAALVDDFNIMAEKLEVASGEIVTWNAAIAHELRTPVTILRGRLQGLADGIFPPEQGLFKNLVRQTEGLARLIEDLRTLSLAASEHFSLRAEKVDIAQELISVVELVKPAMSEKHLSVITKVDSVDLRCDAARIRQMILALLDNARRYAVPGVVLLACQQHADGVIISVEDEGPGIPEDKSGAIFDAFSRLDHSRSRDSGGTGLGLAVVKAIALAHHGYVKYERSELGGAGFKVFLPFDQIP
ncbi:ATP-binding protein [Pantoea cypripedii]|uniref:ATP-binding protein n=1 Tax=Pantoea cypripedii TaxID=55209 RepID=UPI002FCA77D4